MARRVGSASAPKVALSRSGEDLALVGFGTIWFNIGLALRRQCAEGVRRCLQYRKHTLRWVIACPF